MDCNIKSRLDLWLETWLWIKGLCSLVVCCLHPLSCTQQGCFKITARTESGILFITKNNSILFLLLRWVFFSHVYIY